MYIVTPKINSTFGTIGKATGVEMTAKAVVKNSNFCVSVTNNWNMWSWSGTSEKNFEQFFASKWVSSPQLE